ncbi:hypothetical protein, partial [Citrobacter sp. wls758]|uniref:hypothetical protein n=1 Tax=Citrobacter sp. wls758 TaxID=2576416 RepID=UPI001BAF0E31
PTELSGQRGALNRIHVCQSIKFREKMFNRLILRQSVRLCLKFAQNFQAIYLSDLLYEQRLTKRLRGLYYSRTLPQVVHKPFRRFQKLTVQLLRQDPLVCRAMSWAGMLA